MIDQRSDQRVGREPGGDHFFGPGKRLLHVRLHCDVGAIVLAELVRPLGDVDHGELGRQRLNRAVHRHAQEVRAEHEQHVVGLERRAHLFLLARERAHVSRVLARKRRGVGDRGAVHRSAEKLGALRRFGEGVAHRELLPGEDRRPLRHQQHFRNLL